MRTGRPKAELVLSEDERAQLQAFARSRSLPAALSNRARIILSSADEELNSAIAERLKMGNATVGKWRALRRAPHRRSVRRCFARVRRVRSTTNGWRS